MPHAFRSSCLAAVVSAVPVCAQVRPAWQVERPDALSCAAISDDGRIAVALSVPGAPGDLADVVIARYDADGNALGDVRHDFSPQNSVESATAIAFDASNGDVVVRGRLQTFNPPPVNLVTTNFVARLSPTGSLVALAPNVPTLPAGTPSELLAHGGGFYAWSWDRVTRVVAPVATPWSRTYAPGEIQSVVAAPGGDVYVVVDTFVPVRATTTIQRVRPDGTVAWTSAPASALGAVTCRASTDTAGNLVLFGSVLSPSGARSGWLESWDTSGAVRWTTTLPSTTTNALQIARADALGRVVAYAYQPTRKVFAFDGAGALLHESPSDSDLGVRHLLVDSRGELVVAGQGAAAPASELDDMRVVGFDAACVRRWSHQNPGVPGPSFELADVLARYSGGFLLVTGSVDNPTAQNATVIARLVPATRAHCFGDGSEGACPCGNESAVVDSAGCRNSLGTGGRLRSSGDPSLAGDTLVLEGSGMTNSLALYVQGTTSSAPIVFGDGLRCVGGTLARLGTEPGVGGASSFPTSAPGLAVRGNVVAPGVRQYFAWYRNAASFCTSASFNVTNALEVVWAD